MAISASSKVPLPGFADRQDITGRLILGSLGETLPFFVMQKRTGFCHPYSWWGNSMYLQGAPKLRRFI